MSSVVKIINLRQILQVEKSKTTMTKAARKYDLVFCPTCFSASLPCSQVNDRRTKGTGFSYPTAAVSNHAAGVAHQLDELLKGNVLHCPEVGVLLDTLLSHHTHHLFTSCLHSKGRVQVTQMHLFNQLYNNPKSQNALILVILVLLTTTLLLLTKHSHTEDNRA